MAVSKVSRKGLTTIPANVRKELGIEEGDILIWDVDVEKKIAIVRAVKDPSKYLKGKYSDLNIVYDKIEGEADKLIADEIHAHNRV